LLRVRSAETWLLLELGARPRSAPEAAHVARCAGAVAPI
jgi:hypothetical protein